MAKNEASAPVKKRRGSRAITVFNVIFIILLVIAVVVAVLMFTPASKAIKEFLKGQSWAQSFASKYVAWIKFHLCENLGLTMPFRGHGQAFSASLYGFMYALLLLGLLFLMYTPFMVMNHNKKLGRKGGFRKALCWITFIVSTLIFIGYLSVPYTQKITSLVGGAYSWFPNTYNIWKGLFAAGQPLAALKLNFITSNLWFNATFYILVLLVIFQIVMYIMACKIKGKERVEDTVAEEVKEEPAKEEVPVAPVAVAPVCACEQTEVKQEAAVKKEEKPSVDSARVAPTIRELALLNSLEPIEASPISNLPGLYDTEVEKLIDLLEPQINEELAREDESSPDAIEAKRLSETIQPNLVRSITVLPGIDEWGATPWDDELNRIVKPRDYSISILPGIDEWKADPWAEEVKASEEPQKEVVEEEKPVVEEKIEEPIQQEVSETTSDITDVVTPEETAVPVVEEVKEEKVEEEPAKEAVEEDPSRIDKKVVLQDNSHEEVKTEKFYKENEWNVPEYNPLEDQKPEEPKEEEIVEEKVEPIEEKPTGPIINATNFIESDGKRPQEEDHEPTIKGSEESRFDKKETILDNSHEEIKTEKFYKENEWKLPEYVPEPEPVKQEEKVEEKKPEPVKPVANVKQVELKKAPTFNKENKPKIVPIAPITPKAEPKPIEEEPVKQEEKILTPIAGPLHSTAKSKHDKIQAVKAQRVRFELKNYQIKTYQGELSAEEAFQKGVTKVQPTVNPVFANQNDEPEWKQRKRNEEIRKNGYTNVTTVDKLNGAKPVINNSVSSNKGATSIRDLVKAQRVSEEAKVEETEKKDEIKIAKPTAPINFKPVEPMKKDEEPKDNKLNAQNPFSDKQVPAFHPIAPINKKPNNRPVIKPVDPMKKK